MRLSLENNFGLLLDLSKGLVLIRPGFLKISDGPNRI
jgi:hypothetical protein